MENNNKEEVKKVLDEFEKADLKSQDNSINKRKDKKKLWIIIAIVCVIIVGIVIYFKVLEKNCTNNSSVGNNSVVGNFYWNGETDDKPILYLYPEETTQISIKLGNPEKLTCSYPQYKDEWNVTANPDGTLIDIQTGRNLYALYWEGIGTAETDMTEGFVVESKDTIEFLEEKLAILGLTEREAEEFIVYWLPQLQENKYNYIRFATMEEINEYMPLEFSVEPDSLIRILMQYKPLEEYVEVTEQNLETPIREGFVVVEWGGSEIK